MIKSIKFTKGFPTELPCLKGKTFVFKPGLNILFGNNGCGKSTILRALAGRLGCYKGGFTSILEPLNLHRESKTIQDRMTFCNFRDLELGCEIKTDGSRGFYYRGNEVTGETAGHFFFNKSDSPDGLTDVTAQIQIMRSKPSHGMLQQIKIKQVLDLLGKIPAPESLLKKQFHESCQAQADFWKSELARIVGQERITVLLDEPDAHLEIPLQYLLLQRLIPNLSEMFQVILATHNPLVLQFKKTHFPDLNSSYLEEVKQYHGKDNKEIQALINDYLKKIT